MVMIKIDDEIQDLIARALQEDLRGGFDVTSHATVNEQARATAVFMAKAEGVIVGVEIARAVMQRCGISEFKTLKVDGDRVAPGDLIAEVFGPTRGILLAERTALNFMTHLSGVATLTAHWVEQVLGTKTLIRDTRKTTPGLRNLEKYAVRMGGGVNHRSTLAEAALVKDNHIAAAGSVSNAIRAIEENAPTVELEVEVDTLEQLKEALAAGAKFIMLDNMDINMTREAVEITAGRAKLESSGGLSLESARIYAQSGVDFLAVGALTHSAKALDISLDFKIDPKESRKVN